jgi:hypothetical protein
MGQMATINATIHGEDLALSLPASQVQVLTSMCVPTPDRWCQEIERAGSASMAQVSQDQIRQVISLSLQGAGMDASASHDKAWQIVANQNGRQVDLLAARIVRAALAA